MTIELPPAWWSRVDGGVRIAIRASPGARKSALMDVGPAHLRIRLAARPIEGQANTELVRFVAELFGVRRSAVEVVGGHRSRSKIVEIRGLSAPPAEILNLR